MGASHWVLFVFALLGCVSAGIAFGFIKGVNWAAENMVEADVPEVSDDEIAEAFDDDDDRKMKN